MNKIILITLAFTMFSCGQTKTESVASIPAPSTGLEIAHFPNSYKVYEPTASCSTTKRLYMTHGFGGNKDVYDNYPFAPWLESLRSSCFQIISYDLPYGDFVNHFANGGLDYKNNFIAYITGLKSEIEVAHGAVDTNIVGGVSFGGFHALMTIELVGAGFDGFFALKPVTDYTALYELTEKTTSTYFNAFNDCQQLGTKKGLIIYGSQDNRVNWRLTDYLKLKLQNDNLTSVEFLLTNETHATSLDNLDYVVNWLNQNFN